MKHIYISLIFLLSKVACAQKCATCEPVKLAGFSFDVQVPQPQNKELWADWQGLFRLSDHITTQIGQNEKGCIKNTIPPTYDRDGNELFKFGPGIANLPSNPNINQNLSVYGNYLFTGTIKQVGDKYVVHAEIQTTCNRKTVASAEASTPITEVAYHLTDIAGNLVAQLSPVADKIFEFEKKERASDARIAFPSMSTEAISIRPKKRNLGIGEQTELEITMKDCDGEPLGNREIVFAKGATPDFTIPGTTGGTVSPEKVITDAAGKAKATFKMGSSTTAMINAHYIHNTPTGCPFAKLGSTPIGSVPLKVSISYFQNETKTLRRATLPGVDVEGGNEAEEINMSHTAILYHYPSAAAIKKGLLVDISADQMKDSKTLPLLEVGHFNYKKKVDDASIFVIMANKRVPVEVEKGSTKEYSGVAGLEHPSEVHFFTGDAQNPPSFFWNVQYPASNGEDIATGGVSLTKDDDGVHWQVNEIKDPNSPYKTEYVLEQTVDAAEDLKKGNKAMKELFGFDVDGLTKAIDPTKTKDNMVSASGTTTVLVRILSPYSEK